MIYRALLLVVASAAFWLLAVIPARYAWGDMAAVYAGVAMLLCLVPAVLTLLWVNRTVQNDPQQATMVVLGSSGVRMFAVIIVALLLYMQVPLFNQPSFLIWVLVSYLFVLAVEIVLLVRAPVPRQEKAEDRGVQG